MKPKGEMTQCEQASAQAEMLDVQEPGNVRLDGCPREKKAMATQRVLGRDAPSMGVRRTALLTFCDSGNRVASILMIAWPEVEAAARCATTKHTVSASLRMQPQLISLALW